jgi:hypothetical protein
VIHRRAAQQPIPTLIATPRSNSGQTRRTAQKRADYITAALSAARVFGSERDTVRGALLLRVTGKLKPSDGQAYQTAIAQKGNV